MMTRKTEIAVRKGLRQGGGPYIPVCWNVSQSGTRGVAKAELSGEADSENYPGGSLRDDMYYIGLDVHKRTISYCVKDAAGHVHQEGKIGSTRREPWKRRSSLGGSTIICFPTRKRGS